MASRLTTKEWIAKAKALHGDRYNYKKVQYVNTKTKVELYCNIHHKTFTKRADCVLQGQQCPDCAAESRIHKHRKTTEEFIAKAKEVHGDRYDYSATIFVDSSTKVDITCKRHGIFKQRPDGHLGGHGCRKCVYEESSLPVDAFIARANQIHDGKYTYVRSTYTGVRGKIKVICPVHGEYTTSVAVHLYGKKGCRQCAVLKSRSTTEEFIKKAELLHKKLYDYSKVSYITAITSVEIICRKHGVFIQSPAVHLQGSGCPACRNEVSGWTYSNWRRKAEQSKHFDSYKVYILKCYDDKGEQFFKVGKTFTTVAKRFVGKDRLPYEYEVIDIIEGSARHISELEHQIQKFNKDYKYTPQKSFHGETECFSKVLIPNGVKQATAITYSDRYSEIARNIVNIAEVEG